MSDIENNELENELALPENEPEVNTADAQAREQGWRPKEEFQGNPEDWVNAEAYLARGPIMSQVKKLNRRLNSMAEYNQKLMSKVNEAELKGYDRGLQELKYRRDEALDEMDSKTVRALDEQIKNTEAYITQQRQIAQYQEPKPEALDFVRRNQDWFKTDVQKTQIALKLEELVRIEHPEYDDEELYAEIDKRMAPYTGRTGAKTKSAQKPSFVAPPTRGESSAATKSSHSIHDLNPAAKDIYLTIAQFKQDLGQKLSVDDFLKEADRTGTKADMLK